MPQGSIRTESCSSRTGSRSRRAAVVGFRPPLHSEAATSSSSGSIPRTSPISAAPREPGGVVLDETGFPSPRLRVGNGIRRSHPTERSTSSSGGTSVRQTTSTALRSPATGRRDPDGILISSGQGGSHPAIAFDDENYLVAWEDDAATAILRGPRDSLRRLLDPGGSHLYWRRSQISLGCLRRRELHGRLG